MIAALVAVFAGCLAVFAGLYLGNREKDDAEK